MTLSGPTKALDLVGPKTMQDTLKCVEFGGIVCNTGVLGGVYTMNGFDPIKAIPNGVYLTGFTATSLIKILWTRYSASLNRIISTRLSEKSLILGKLKKLVLLRTAVKSMEKS